MGARSGVSFRMIEKRNLFLTSPDNLEKELFETLASGSGEFKIERIVSRGHSSAADFWYDQETTEWIVLLSGYGRLQFENPAQVIVLEPGDWIEIPARVRHRVEATSEEADTIWLAVHWTSSPRESDSTFDKSQIKSEAI